MNSPELKAIFSSILSYSNLSKNVSFSQIAEEYPMQTNIGNQIYIAKQVADYVGFTNEFNCFRQKLESQKNNCMNYPIQNKEEIMSNFNSIKNMNR